MRLTKLIIGSLIASLVMTVLMLLMPADKAYAYGYCSNPNDLASRTSGLSISPDSGYAGDTVNTWGYLEAKNWSSGKGYYTFYYGKKFPRTYAAVNKSPATIPSSSRYGFANISKSNGNILVYSFKNNGTFSNACWIRSGAFTWSGSVKVKPAETVDPKVVGFSGGNWGQAVTIRIDMNTTGGQTPNGRLNWKLNLPSGYTGSIPVNSNTVYVTINPTQYNFAVYNMQRECNWPFAVSNWQFGTTCQNEWWNNGENSGIISYGLQTAHLVGGNVFHDLSFTSYNPNKVENRTVMIYWWEYFLFSTAPIRQVSDGQLWSTANANRASGSNSNGISKAGFDEKNLPRLNKSCENSNNCNGWQALERYGTNSYAWYALQSANNTNKSYYVNCEPEGNGRVKFAYYDYGQSPYVGKNKYDEMKARSYYLTYNIKRPVTSSGGYDGILGGYGNRIWNTNIVNTDWWNTVKPYPHFGIYYQNWGISKPSCIYPSASAWVGSSTTMSLPSSQFVNGRYIFSTAMSIRLGSLDVRGGSGADNRTLPANPVTIQIRGPLNRDVNVFCLANSNPANCIGQAVTRLNVAGDYNIRACWNGDVTSGGKHRVFTGSCSGFIPFRVYETFSCDFPETPGNNITIGPDSQGQVISGVQGGTPQIIRSGDKIRVTYPNVTLANFKGLVSVPSPPAGEPQIKGRTRIADGSNPSSSSDVRLYDASGREIDANRGGSLEWNDGIEIANPVHFISYYWPSAINASGRASIQIERRIWVYATAFDPAKGATAPPDTQYWSCSSVGSRDIPHSSWIQIINSQLTQ